MEFLRKLNLSEGEIKLYETLLEFGDQGVQKLNERVKIDRRNIYDILNKLIGKGLVSYINENKKKVYRITNPNKIINYLDEKQGELEATKEDVKAEMNSLMTKFNQTKSNISAQVFRGDEGMKAVWTEIADDGHDMYWIGSGYYFVDKFPHFFTSWNKKRKEKGVVWHNLFRDEFRDKVKDLGMEKRKFLPPEFTNNTTVIGIFGDKVVNLLFLEEFFAVVIENKELADSYRRYHKYLWDNIAIK
jgi:sugar-specific transcriptional regulator TrmB